MASLEALGARSMLVASLAQRLLEGMVRGTSLGAAGEGRSVSSCGVAFSMAVLVSEPVAIAAMSITLSGEVLESRRGARK